MSRARSPHGQRDVLRLRFLSAFVGVPVLLLLAVVGGGWYVAAVVVGAIVASLEMFGMLAGAGYRPVRPLGVVLSVAMVLVALVTDARIMPAVLVAAILVGLFQMMARPEPAAHSWTGR